MCTHPIKIVSCQQGRTQKQLDELVRIAYHRGYLAGLGAYAWWKDGVQYVGTSGVTLKEAREQAKQTYNYNP